MSSSFDTFSMDGEEQIHHQSSNHHPFNEDEAAADSYSNYAPYSSLTGAADDFPADHGDVPVDHVQSPEIFGFDGQDPGYSQSPFDSVHVENGNGNGYGGGEDSVFASDGPILPPPTEMESEEGFALREWRR